MAKLDIFKTLTSLPIVKTALEEQAAALVRERAGYLKERSAAERNAANRLAALARAREAATAARLHAETLFLTAVREEVAASSRLDGEV